MSDNKLSAAQIEAKKRFPGYFGDRMGPSIDTFNETQIEKQKAFVEGAEWRKEQDKPLYEALLKVEKYLREWLDQTPADDPHEESARYGACDEAKEAIKKYLDQ